jgi:hypothetical protein
MSDRSNNFDRSDRLGQKYNRYDGNTLYKSINDRDFDVNDYNSNLKNVQQLSISNEPDIKYKIRDEYIVISSIDRDITNYPSPSKYTITLPYELRNINSIELVNGVIPDQNNVTQEPYLLLNIQELENVMISTNKSASDSFAILHLAKPIASGYFINVDKKTFERVILNYVTPKASLSKLTISITDAYGNLFNFGDDSGGPHKSLQNMFILKATIIEKSRDVIGQRNVY